MVRALCAYIAGVCYICECDTPSPISREYIPSYLGKAFTAQIFLAAQVLVP
ncbi:hypothetical protein APHNP_0131 [Anaplasma phagocytophilum str. ApNP]|uniref:Uncharacterized protein n=1 Tax=Anaplasma phagocytophilum str. ApNP TaxID=1359153 RepID=A0A0F3NHA5_ANAPH|nr:hypothetical protein APHNP_0131 [Anaplasma phagocytophilum str. ApNP]